MFVVECTSTIKNVCEPIKINNDLKIVCTTNCFISKEMKKYEMNLETYKSIERYNNVIDAFDNFNETDIIYYIKDILKGNHGFMCQYDKNLNFETVWSSVFDLNTLEITRAEGNPRKYKYKNDFRIKIK